MRTLFDISDDLLVLGDLLEEAGGDITDEQAELAVNDFFAELGTERDLKLDSYCALYRQFEAKAKARKEEAARLTALAATDENNADKLKKRLLEFLRVQNLPKIETARFKISRQTNGGKVPVIFNETFIANPVELPEEIRRVTFSPDADALRGLLESGDTETRECYSAYGQLGERGEHLRIK